MVINVNKYYKLLSGYTPTPLQDARALLRFVLNADPLLTWRDLTEDEEEKLLLCIEKRKSGIPIAYITGEKEFMGLSFHVNEHTLIPRPDTELITETLIEENQFASPRILDLCSGSGCIGISLAHFIKTSSVTMWDISPEAIEVSTKNIARHNLKDRVVSKLGNVLKDEFPISDIIVSNPPYIEDDVVPTLEVSKFEPHLALKGGSDGLLFYRAIIPKAYSSLTQGGILAFEIGYNQGVCVKELMENYFENVKVLKDYGDNDRMVYAQKNVVP